MFEDVEEVRNEGEQPLHFYYNREERLAKAPQSVKDFYAGKMKPVKGFRVFFTKQNRYIFFSLILVFSFALATTGLTKARTFTQIKGINSEMQAFSYDEEVYVSIQFKRSSKSEDLSSKNIEAQIKLIDPNNAVSEVSTQSIVYSDGEQYIREKFTDYDIIRVDVVLTCEDQKKEMSAEVKR